MKKPFYKSWWFISITSILIVLGIGLAVLSSKFETILEDRLRTSLNSNKQSLYSINFKSLRVHLMLGSISLNELKIEPNQRVLDSLDKLNIHQSMLATIELKKLKVHQVNLKQMILDQVVSMREISFDNPKITLEFTGYKKEVKDTIDVQENVHRIAKLLQNASIHSINLKNADLVLVRSESPEKPMLTVKHLNVSLEDFKIDTAMSYVPIDLEEMKISSGNIEYHLSDKSTLSVSNSEISFADSSIALSNFSFSPTLDRKEFSKKLKYQQTWNNISAKSILLSGFDIDDFIFHSQVIIEDIEITEPKIDLYKDKAPKWPAHKVHEIPGSLIQKIPMDMLVKHITVKQGSLRFEQKPENKDETGVLTISDLYVSIDNFTNLDSLLDMDPALDLNANFVMMGKAKIDAKLTFFPRAANDKWKVYATVYKSKMNIWNQILFPLTNVKILDGEIIKVDLAMNCSRTVANGTIDMDYKNAKMDIMTLDETTNELKKRELISWAANEFVRSNNVKGTKNFQQGNIDYTRTLDEPFFRFLWFAVQSGIKDTFIGKKHKPGQVKKDKEKGKLSIKFKKRNKNKKAK